MSRRGSAEPGLTRGAVQERVRQMLVLERLGARLPLIAQRLQARPSQRPGFTVADERDLQELVGALLLLDHEGVQPATWTPPYAAGAPRTDYRLALERSVVVVRLARAGWGPAELAHELAADVAHYQASGECRTLVCLVYDPAGQWPDPRATEAALSGDHGALAARVFIAVRRA